MISCESEGTIQKILEEFVKINLEDEITFTFKSIGDIHKRDEYTGNCVALSANYPLMALPLKLSVKGEDKIILREVEYKYKLMMEDCNI